MKTCISIILLMAMFLSLVPGIGVAAIEADARKTIYYPNASQTTMIDSMIIPPGSDSVFTDTKLTAAKNTAADQGFAYSKDTIDLVNHDYQWIYTIRTGNNGSIETSNDLGSTFNLFHTEPGQGVYSPGLNNDYGTLGIYARAGDTRTNYLPNAIAVEFDNWNQADSTGSEPFDDGQNTARGSHVAITFPERVPEGSRLQHYAFINLPDPYSNNTQNTVKITWKLIDEGTSIEASDNTYRLEYSYYQATTDYLGSPTVSGSMDLTYQQMITRFKDPTQMNFGISATTAALINRGQDMQWVPAYDYTINYYYKTTTAQETTLSVYEQRRGKAPLGSFDAGPMEPDYLEGFSSLFRLATVDSGERIRTINTTGNVFNFYYEQIPKTLVIEKRDSSTDEAMGGVSFTLTGDSETRTFSTDADGRSTLEGLYRYDDALEPITYTLTETLPEGYLPKEPIQFEVTETGDFLIQGENVSDEGTYLIYNEPYGSIQISKTDTTNPLESKPLSGVGFRLEKLNSTEVYEAFRPEVLTDEEGQILWDELPYGSYRIIESGIPEHYNPLNQSIIVTVNDTTRNPMISLQNQMIPVMPTSGGFGPWTYTLVGAIATLLGFIIILRTRKETIQ